MKFVNPYILFGLLAISIPVIIHLFNFRRFRKVLFSNVAFLKEIKQETQKKSRVKHLLVLFTRILAVVSIVLAFAQPYIPVGTTVISSKGSIVSIYVDNSFSMQAVSKKGTLFDDALSKAREIAEAYKSTDLFQILTNNFEGRHQFYYTKEEFLQLISDLEVSPSSRKLSEVIARQNDLFSTVSGKDKIAYILSDFSQSNSELSEIVPDTSVTVHFLPLSVGETSNLFIDSCWFDSPVKQVNQNVQLSVLIKNMSETDAEKIPVKLTINGKQKALASADITAGSETEVKLPYVLSESGIQSAVVEIIDNPVVFDDRFFLSYTVSDRVKVLDIFGTSGDFYVNSLFGNDSAFDLISADVNKLDYSEIILADLVILDGVKSISSGLKQELVKYIGKTGSVIVFPGADADLNSYNSLTEALGTPAFQEFDTTRTKVSDINIDHEIYHDVFESIPENMDMPEVYKHYPIKGKVLSLDETIMKLMNGDPFLLSVKSGSGVLYLSSVPLDAEFSNFPRHALFVPTLYNIALLSVPFGKLYYVIGNEVGVEVKNREASGEITFRIKALDKDFEFIPEHRNIELQTTVFPHDQIKESGNYLLMLGDEEIEGLSFNYDRSESVMKFYNSEQLSEMILSAKDRNPLYRKYYVFDLKDKPISKVMEEMNQGIKLWKIFIILALIFLFSEVMLLRFLKS